jgi:hypothetical protein
MHDGDGMMREEIERVRKRAEAASSRKSGYSYQSPLGNGFSFDKGRPMGEQTNPFSRRRPHRTNSDQHHGEIRIEYEESYFDMNGDDFDTARRVMKSKERIVERMNEEEKIENVREVSQILIFDEPGLMCSYVENLQMKSFGQVLSL